MKRKNRARKIINNTELRNIKYSDVLKHTERAHEGNPHSDVTNLWVMRLPLTTFRSITSVHITAGFIGFGYFLHAACTTVSHGWLKNEKLFYAFPKTVQQADFKQAFQMFHDRREETETHLKTCSDVQIFITESQQITGWRTNRSTGQFYQSNMFKSECNWCCLLSTNMTKLFIHGPR